MIGPTTADIDTVSSHGNLVTDGSFLYWQSDTAINKMSVRGGAVTVLDRTPLTRPAVGLHVVGPNVIYAVDRVVYYVPVDGPVVNPACYACRLHDRHRRRRLRPAGGIFLRGRSQRCHWVACRRRQLPDQTASRDGVYHLHGLRRSHSALAWTQMAGAWQLRLEAGVNNFTFATGANPRLAMFNPAGQPFWLDDNGVIAST